MNIAIFGDSFADDTEKNLLQSESSWVDILRENGHNVINHSKSGSSLYYSYKKYLDFIKTPMYRICDLVIFVITGWGREEIIIDGETFYLTSASQLEVVKNVHADTEEKRKIIDSVITYWAFCKDFTKEEIIHDLMAEDIKKREKIFYIETNKGLDGDSLIQLSMKELSLMNPSIQNFEEERDFMKMHKDLRKCHFTSVNNRMLGNKIFHAILSTQKTVNFNINDIVKPDLDYRNYFQKYDK